MAQFPSHLKYTQTHEWLEQESEDVFLLGITDFAQDSLGDVVFVELPELNRHVAKDEAFAVVESVKAASDIYAPIAGEIIAVNEDLNQAPEQINQNPYGAWLVRIKAALPDEVQTLLSSQDYSESVSTI